jgi:hypothetical protein
VPEPGNPQSLNRYTYALNNSVRYTDPTGHWVFEQTPEDQYFIPFFQSPTGSSMYVESDPCFGSCNGPSPVDEQTKAIGEAVVGTLWEPADWAITFAHWADGDFHVLDLVGLLPLASASVARVGRHLDDLAGIASATRRYNWGNVDTLADHFGRHGAGVSAESAEDYARMASEFLQNAPTNGYSIKVDVAGTIRVYDPTTNTFGSYSPDGTTKTFFKPTSPTYWERQPGSAPWLGGE